MMKQLHKVDFLSRITDVLLAMKSSISSLDSNSLLSIMCKSLICMHLCTCICMYMYVCTNVHVITNGYFFFSSQLPVSGVFGG